MRRIIDFDNTEKTMSVLPTGQSGYFLAPHYADQANLFNNNGFRFQWMNKNEILRQADKEPLILSPLTN
jgi:penicillin amidase